MASYGHIRPPPGPKLCHGAHRARQAAQQERPQHGPQNAAAQRGTVCRCLVLDLSCQFEAWVTMARRNPQQDRKVKSA